MKFFSFIYVLMLFAINNNAQINIDKYSIDSGGANGTSGNLSITYTLGETVVQEANNANIYISEGFLNPNLSKKVNIENYTSIESIKVFPNPTIDFVNIRFAEIDDFEISIFKNSGRLVSKTKYSHVHRLSLNIKNFISGMYLILIKNNNKKQYKTYKIVKQN